MEHLLEAERPEDWSESVLWVGATPPEPALAQCRFDVRRLTRAELSSYRIDAAPLLIAVDPEDHARSSGEYTDTRPGPVVDDLRILAAARASTPIEGLPVFGRAVGARLKMTLARLPSP